MNRGLLSISVAIMAFLNLPVSAQTAFEIGQRVVVIEPCPFKLETGARDGGHFVIVGACLTVEGIQGSRLWTRITVGGGWIEMRHVASLQDGERIFSQWIAEQRRLSDAYLGLGNIRVLRGDHQGAIADLSEAVRLNPGAARIRHYRGMCYFRTDQLDLAIVEYTECLRLTSNGHDLKSRGERRNAFYERGLTRYQQGRFVEAIADFDNAIQLFPSTVLAYNRRGMAWRMRGDRQKALADFDKALQLSPRFSAPRNFRGKTLEDLGHFEEAIVEYEKAREIAPDAVFILGSPSYDLHVQLSNSEASSPRDYWRLDPIFSVQNNLARLLVECPDTKLRDPSRAMRLVELLRRHDRGRYYEFMITEAAVYAALGKRDQAVHILRQAADAAPPDERASVLDKLTSY